MLFTSLETLDEVIVRLLTKGKTTPSELFDSITEEGDKSTIQAKYKALRALIQATVVVKSGKEISLNLEWLEKITNSFHSQTSLPILADGESATYRYNTLTNLDGYWKHLMKSFDDQMPNCPVFLYNPYNIWYHISDRTQSEADYYDGFQRKHQYGFYVIGNNSEIDQKFKKEFQSDFLQIDTWTHTPMKDNDCITIIGDYVIHTILDKQVVQTIANHYKYMRMNEEASSNLNKMLIGNHRCKIKIERNSKKAKLLRKKLSKNFFIPKKLKIKYNLF